jgi:hypothetical protein
MKAELPRETVGTGDLTNTTRLIPLPADPHLTLAGEAVDLAVVTSVVLYGVPRFHFAIQVVLLK